MKTYNPENERIKRTYARWLKEAEGHSPDSVDQALAAIHRFEADTRYRSFKTFHVEEAVAFKRRLADQKNPKTGKPLSKSTLLGILNANRKFFHWLAGQPGYRSRISFGDANYFRLSGNEARAARATRTKNVATLEQIRHVLEAMPAETEIQKRDRALIAFTILTGARDGAIATIRIKHVDVVAEKIVNDPDEMKVKGSKRFETTFFPVGDDILAIFKDWMRFLQNEKLFGPNDPVFPATKVGLGADRKFAAVGLDRKHWSNAQAIRKVFAAAFEAVGLPASNPHSFRDTLVRIGQKRCGPPEEFKAWSQNLGHEKVMTTFTSYGTVSPHRQAEIIKRLNDADGIGSNGLAKLDRATAELLVDTLMKAAS